MIWTVTCNPSLDYLVEVDDFKADSLNRIKEERITAGGKGINVSIVLKNLGHENTALGFTAGFTGEEIERQLKDRGIKCDFTYLKEGNSRINVKVFSDQETEINGKGPEVKEEDIEALIKKLDVLKEGDILILSGKGPSSTVTDIYLRILDKLQNSRIKTVIDIPDGLLECLKYHPFLIKPNQKELAEILKIPCDTEEEILKGAEILQSMGAVNVLVSRGKDGAFFLSEKGEIFSVPALKGNVVNTIGAGDSMVAGFVAGYLETGDLKEAFQMAVCTASASTFSAELATRKEVNALLKKEREVWQ